MYMPVGKDFHVVRGQITSDLQVRKIDCRIVGIDHIQLGGRRVLGRHHEQRIRAGDDRAKDAAQYNNRPFFE